MLDNAKSNDLQYIKLLVARTETICNFITDINCKIKNLNFELKGIIIDRCNDNLLKDYVKSMVELISEEYKIIALNKIQELE